MLHKNKLQIDISLAVDNQNINIFTNALPKHEVNNNQVEHVNEVDVAPPNEFFIDMINTIEGSKRCLDQSNIPKNSAKVDNLAWSRSEINSIHLQKDPMITFCKQDTKPISMYEPNPPLHIIASIN